MKVLLIVAAALVAASSLPVFGQNLNFDLTSSGSSLLATGETRTFTSNGVTMKALAVSYTGGNNEFFEASRLGQYGSSGLGVTNKHEDGSSPEHRVDNFKHNDYILFTFDNLVNVTSIQIASIVDDSDVSYWVGNLRPTSDSQISYSDLASVGFGNEQVDSINQKISSRSVTINSPGSGINAIVFGAQRGLDSGEYLDQFKVKHLKATTLTVVPEPSAALLSLVGVFALCVRRKR